MKHPLRVFTSVVTVTVLAFGLSMQSESRAQTPEVFLGDPNQLWGDDAAMPKEEPENYLAKCLADPTDRVSCHLAQTSKTDGGLESALTGALETVVVDYSEGEEPTIRRSEDDSTATTPPATIKEPEGNQNLTMVELNVFFDYNSTTFVDGEEAKVTQLAAALKHPAARNLNFLVLGHTDAVGSDAYNCRLSSRRADALVTALTDQGVPADRLKAIGVGETILKNTSDGAADENRRVGFAQLGNDADTLVARMQRLCDLS